MAKFEKRMRARDLRRRGWSIRSIASRLEVSRASASIWCRDLVLTHKQQEHLRVNAIKAGHAGRMKGAQMNHERKQARISFHREAGAKEIISLSPRDALVAGIALYWAEGSRKSRLAFVNSEPEMIVLMSWWFEKIMGVRKNEFMPRIFINDIHRPRIGKVLNFWSDLLRLPRSQFGNPVFLKKRPRKIYENYDSYYGVLSLGVRRSGELKYRVLGLIEALKNAERIAPV